MEVMLTLGEILTSPLLDRHPRLRLVLAEADTGWLPWLLARVDRGHERYARQNDIRTELETQRIFPPQRVGLVHHGSRGRVHSRVHGRGKPDVVLGLSAHGLHVAALAGEHRARLRGRLGKRTASR